MSYRMNKKRKKHVFVWPVTLLPRKNWLVQKGMDVDSIETERRAFLLVRTISRERMPFPADRRASLLPALQRMQQAIGLSGECTGKAHRMPGKVARTKGTFGAASPARSISVEEYLAGKSKPDPSAISGVRDQ